MNTTMACECSFETREEAEVHAAKVGGKVVRVPDNIWFGKRVFMSRYNMICEMYHGFSPSKWSDDFQEVVKIDPLEAWRGA